jgi:hypothetical protein
MRRSYWSSSASEFAIAEPNAVLGALSAAHPFDITDLQKNAWIYEIGFLKEELPKLPDPHILLEYSIPRMGKRVDAVLIAQGFVLLLEFKVGAKEYSRHDVAQVLDYALDLKYFHSLSGTAPLVPILIATSAEAALNSPQTHSDLVCSPICVNPDTFAPTLAYLMAGSRHAAIDPKAWEGAEYCPTPTIIEAAQVLYSGHSVSDISRSDAANLSSTTDAVMSVIERAKQENRKTICFITGVPGSGKTLAGLNIATQRQRANTAEHAVFLSGNGPLVNVLQEALARSNVSSGGSASKSEALTKTRAFIQLIHHFRDEALLTNGPPVEKVAVFDEAQRAWTLDQTRKFMAQKKGISDFNRSEAEFLLAFMDRHKDWAVLVCLIGGGQEINTGEAGLPEWFRAIGDRFRHWDVFVSDKLAEYEYDQGTALYGTLNGAQLTFLSDLHLATSIRSFRSENVSAFVKALLDNDQATAKTLHANFRAKYPVFVTRDISLAKEWVRTAARGSERYGLTASSGAHRLRPLALTVRAKVDPPTWFLNDAADVRSSCFLEEVATEFDIQGLELDWTIVAWDADLRMAGVEWSHFAFRGTEWQKVSDPLRKMYLKNAYRVLLTRARQGMVIFVPRGEVMDLTRLPEYYNGTYEYIKSVGIRDLGEA